MLTLFFRGILVKVPARKLACIVMCESVRDPDDGLTCPAALSTEHIWLTLSGAVFCVTHRLAMLREASDETVAEEGAEVKSAEGSRCVEDVSSCPSVPEMNEDASRKESSCASDLGSQPPAGTPALVSVAAVLVCPSQDMAVPGTPASFGKGSL